MVLGMVLFGCGPDTGGGVFIPPDTPPAPSSLQFSPVNSGLNTADALDVKIITMVNPLFAGTKGGIFKSSDGGGSWTGASEGILPDAEGKRDIKVIVADPQKPQTLYAGAKNGVFKSSDQGANWTSKSIGILPDSKGTTEIKEGSFVVHPTDSNTLYAGTKNGLFKTIDGGENWTLVEKDLFPTNPDGDHEVKSLLLDPTNPLIFYVGTRDGFFKSTDGGITWVQTDRGMDADLEGRKEVKSLAIDPASPKTLYAGTRAGVFKTTDGGTTWKSATAGITPDDKQNKDIRWIALDPKNPGRLYAATKMGIFVTNDGGTGWSAANKGLTNTDARVVLIDPADSNVVYVGTKGGIFKGTVTAGGEGDTTAPETITTLTATQGANSGEVILGWTAPGDDGNVGTAARYDLRWSSSTLTDANFAGATPVAGLLAPKAAGSAESFTVTGLTPGVTLFFAIKASDEAGNLSALSNVAGSKVSTGGAPAWAAVNSGLTDPDVKSLAMGPITPAITLYAGTKTSLFKTENGGVAWTASVAGINPKPADPAGTRDVKALAVDPSNISILYAGTNNTFGPYRSSDGGVNWTLISNGLPNANSKDVRSVAIDPTPVADPLTGRTVYLGTKGGIFKSTDSGSTWAAANAGLTPLALDVKQLLPVPGTPSTLYAATKDGVYKSSDSGGTWTKVSAGLATPAALDVKALAIDPTNPQTLYAGTANGLFKTTDGGGNWTQSDTGITANAAGNRDIKTLAIVPTNPLLLYAGTATGVFKSEDGGVTWTDKNTGLTSLDVRSMAIDPTNPLVIYVGTAGGVFMSVTGGE